ncbi:MAG: DUF4115 domain-containing protein [Candidatus Magnetoovum sp. WYHC-5]|nr:DUF4115 domain-containing protein [Candidatus Magnetoovum sp. WYHC-5]
MVGQYLTNLRESANLTIEQLSQKTNVRRQYIMALESNAFNKLPADIYIKGYIRAYISALGLKPDEGLNLYEEYKKQYLLTDVFFEEDIEDIKNMLNGHLTKRHSYLNYVFTCLILSIAAVLFIYSTDIFSTEHKNSETEELAALNKKQHAINSIYGPRVFGELILQCSDFTTFGQYGKINFNRNSTVTDLVKVEPNYMSLIPYDYYEETMVANNTKDVSIYDLKLLSRKHKGLEAAIHEQHTLKISAVAKTWVTVQIDKKNNINFLLKTGESRTFVADELITVRIGNAGGIKLTYNDEELGVIGRNDEEVTFSIH